METSTLKMKSSNNFLVLNISFANVQFYGFEFYSRSVYGNCNEKRWPESSVNVKSHP